MANSMNERDETAFKYFLSSWKTNWDLNQYYRMVRRRFRVLSRLSGREQLPDDVQPLLQQIPPRVFTVLSRFMEQLYQGGTGDLVSVRPRKRGDVDRAPRVAGLLNYQLENLNACDGNGGSYYHNFQWMFNALTFGKGITKLYWKKEDRMAPRRMMVPVPKMDPYGRIVGMDILPVTTNDMQTIYDGPYAEVVHNKLFNPHPHYRNIQKMPFVGCLYSRSIDYIKRKADQGVFRNIDQLGWSSINTSDSGYGTDSGEAFAKSISIEGVSQNDINTAMEKARAPMVDVIEGYGRYIFPEDEVPYEIGSGVSIKGMESEAIVHIGNYKTLLSLEKNPYQVRPFFDIGCYYHPELYWDIGIVRLGERFARAVQQHGQHAVSERDDAH